MSTSELLDGRSGLSRLGFELRRHARWAREEGIGKLVEEDQLNVLERAPVAARKVWWRSTHGVEAGLSTPVFLVGVQRSGTNMVVRGLERSPEFAVHNENDRRVFHRYELKGLQTVRHVVGESRARYTLFKPLCDSHRTDQLLDHLGTTMPPRAIWAYRGMEGRVRVVALEVPRPQPDRHGGHRRRPLPRALAGPGPPAGDHAADPQLRLGGDDAGVGLGAVLVRPQPAPVRP